MLTGFVCLWLNKGHTADLFHLCGTGIVSRDNPGIGREVHAWSPWLAADSIRKSRLARWLHVDPSLECNYIYIKHKTK